jgi:hypothetical protein
MGRTVWAILFGLLLCGCGQAVLAAKLNSLNDQFDDRIQSSQRDIPAAIVGKPYELQLRATGGQPPYRWQIIQGNLPAGLALDPSGGRITGIPETEFPDTIVVLITDASDDPENYLMKTLHPSPREGAEK